jgi:SAM-dependent methyltransferase
MALGNALSFNLAGLRRRHRGVAREYYRRFRPIRLDEPLPPSGCRIQIEALKPIFILEKAEAFTCPLRVRNAGSHAWSSRGSRPLVLQAHWQTWKNEPMPLPPARLPLPNHLRPGEELILDARFRAPDCLGDFGLTFTPLQEPDNSFLRYGAVPVKIACHVTGRHREDIDYYRLYAQADLQKNYWLVVGPTTKEEYDRLGGVKLKHLVDLGLTPDARVLDVGCGTGLLTTAMEGYLTERGAYVGTDVGKEAIDFCKKRFRRPNFSFAQNDMTSIPVAGPFDCVAFYSVFTHTFPDETALLLNEAKRVLAPGGFVFADLFTSPLVERYTGNRGAVEVNLDHFLRLVELVGLNAELVMKGACEV